MHTSIRRLVPLAVLVPVVLAGCAAPKKEAEYDANGKKIEYVYYTPTGSNIPVKIRKDQLQSSDTDSEKTQEALRELLLRGTHQDKQAGGN